MTFKQQIFLSVAQIHLRERDPAEPDDQFYGRIVKVALSVEKAASVFLGKKGNRRHAQ